MTAQRLQQAKDLDVSLNHEEKLPVDRSFDRPLPDRSFEKLTPTTERPTEQKPSTSKPMLSPIPKKDTPGILTVLGNNEIDKARREEVKKMVQHEYNQFVAH